MGARRQYADVLIDRAARGDVASLIGHGLRWVATALGPRRHRALGGPALGTLLVTYRCDLRCRVCDLPARAAVRRRAGDRELDTAGFRAVLRDMKAIGTAGVGFTGGEPMLRPDILPLLTYADRLGLHAHLNSDGFRVAEQAEALVASGARSINLSLDGATPAVHDTARRRPGSFDTVCAALEALRAARGRRRLPRLTVVTVLTGRNLPDAGAVVETAVAAGADRVGVIPVHDFGHGETAPEPDAIQAALVALRRLHHQGLVDNSTGYLSLLPRALRGEPSPLFCYAPYASVVVDCYGQVYPCFPLMERDQPVGTIPLAPLWRSAAYTRARAALAGCTACLWNCHTEMNLVLPQGALAPRAPHTPAPLAARAAAAEGGA
jgi:MoaA/NifB/PqqE/SkfB family radical SAM enzyme